jgi:hypothetical protein
MSSSAEHVAWPAGLQLAETASGSQRFGKSLQILVHEAESIDVNHFHKMHSMLIRRSS